MAETQTLEQLFPVSAPAPLPDPSLESDEYSPIERQDDPSPEELKLETSFAKQLRANWEAAEKGEEPQTQVEPVAQNVPEPTTQEAAAEEEEKEPVPDAQEPQKAAVEEESRPVLTKDVETVLTQHIPDATARAEVEKVIGGVEDRLKGIVEPLYQVASPVMEYARQTNANPQQLVTNFLTFDHTLMDPQSTEQQKLQVVEKVLETYGLNLNDHYEKRSPYAVDDAGNPVDPREKDLYDAQEAARAAQRQTAALQRQQNVVQQSQGQDAEQAFANAKDAQGNLLHPYFQEVYPTMVDLAQARVAQAQRTGQRPAMTMESLYDEAVYANPATRQKVIQSQVNQTAASQVRTQKAKEAARGVSGTSGPKGEIKPTGTFIEQLRRNFDAAGL